MKASDLQAAVEAILFAAGEPLHIKKLAEVLQIEADTIQKTLNNLEAQLEERGSGLCLVRMSDTYQLCTRSEFAEEVRSVLEIKRNTPLSQAAFEVLAVIAYNQPVTKSFVEQVRGVDCSGVVTTLCQKGLIEEKGRMNLPGKPLIYGTTPDFLRCFCISSLNELPKLPENEGEKELFESEKDNELDNELIDQET